MSSVQDTQASEQIALVNQAFEDAMKDGSASGLTAIYTDNGQLLPPNGVITTGTDAIQAYWAQVIESGITSADLETIELDLVGTTAIEVGSYVMKKGDDVADVGKYIVIWKCENDKWMYHRDMWSSDLDA